MNSKFYIFCLFVVKAFHLKFDEMKLDTNVSKWSVEIIELSRSKRHLDRANLLKFWSLLDQHIMKHKHNVVRYWFQIHIIYLDSFKFIKLGSLFFFVKHNVLLLSTSEISHKQNMPFRSHFQIQNICYIIALCSEILDAKTRVIRKKTQHL